MLTTIDALLTDHTDAEVAALLNAQGFTTGAGQLFTGDRVKWLHAAKGLPSLRHRLRAAHLLTAKELATALGVSYDTGEGLAPTGTAARPPLQRQGRVALRAAE